jgi:hypothetical protein
MEQRKQCDILLFKYCSLVLIKSEVQQFLNQPQSEIKEISLMRLIMLNFQNDFMPGSHN